MISTSSTPRLVAAVTLATISIAHAAPIMLDADGAQNVSNLQQVALAMLNYESANGRLPAAYLGPVGTPLLSWRVAILPYVDQSALYSQFDLNKPWDDPANIGLLAQMPAVFRSPLNPSGSTNTSYVVGSGPTTVFPGSPGVPSVSISDGTSNTILVGESYASSIPWTKPEDIAIGSCPTLGGSGFSSFIPGAVPFAFSDGSVKFLPNDIACNPLSALFGRNDGTVVDMSVALDYVVVPVPEPSPSGIMAAIFSAVAFARFRRSKRRRSQVI
jgi:hypothetical protein